MSRKPTRSAIRHLARQCVTALLAAPLLATLAGCGNSETRVEIGNREKVLHATFGAEPEDLDPHVITGVPEHHVVTTLLEGLVTEDPKTLEPIPGMAERWERSEDGLTWTFYLRDANWSNGDPVTAHDFVQSFERILTPALGSTYSYMLFAMKNAEAFADGAITDFSQVGAKAIDDKTLEIQLGSPTPYFLSLLNHYTWFPVHMPTVEKHGDPLRRGNAWTQPGNYVGNGPFTLVSWRTNDKIVVEKNPDYWDAETVQLNQIHFYAMESQNTQENAYRAGQLHNIYTMPLDKIQVYKKNHPDELHIAPHIATYFYRFNTTREPFNDPKIRRAFAMAIDRDKIVKYVAKGEQIPAFNLTPPGTGGYTARSTFEENVDQAKELLAEAGYPNGEGLPPVEILYNTQEAHRIIAETIQQMWLENLGVEATLVNQEWKVYLDSQRNLDYHVSRAGWTADYPDPNSFLDMFTSWSQQNQTGWSDPEYDALIRQAAQTLDPDKRFDLFQQAEAILVEHLPIMPIYFYTRVYALRPSVKGWYDTMLDHHPFKYIRLADNQSAVNSN